MDHKAADGISLASGSTQTIWAKGSVSVLYCSIWSTLLSSSEGTLLGLPYFEQDINRD